MTAQLEKSMGITKHLSCVLIYSIAVVGVLPNLKGDSKNLKM